MSVLVGQAVEPKHVLFVDDDMALLDGLRDAMRQHRRRWVMRFADSGETALAAIAQSPCDIVISDLRMPGLDGAAFLEQVRERSPTTIRIVLSGHAESSMVARASSVAHQMLSKPCETEQLVATIERACQLADTIARVELRRATVGMSLLPSTPHLHSQLSQVLSSDDVSIHDITRIVEQDMAISAKILQLANSAYFGRHQPVGAIGGAISYLGLDTVRALVTQVDTFRQFNVERQIEDFSVEQLQRHSWRVATLARQLVHDPALQPAAFAAGLLHDVGMLVLAAYEATTLARILTAARERQCSLFEVERELCGVTHAAIGAHLLTLWGLPIDITSAIAAQDSLPAGELALDAAGATYLANALIEEADTTELPAACCEGSTDLDRLAERGLGGELLRWRQLAARIPGAASH
jgi:HD-like signal output (HDOD) protein